MSEESSGDHSMHIHSTPKNRCMRAFNVDLAFSGMGVCTHKRMILFFSISLSTIGPVFCFFDKQCCSDKYMKVYHAHCVYLASYMHYLCSCKAWNLSERVWVFVQNMGLLSLFSFVGFQGY
jgi:hypothetical protein